MGKSFDCLTDDHRRFIAAQHLFFVATVAPGARVNLSPRGTDLFRVLDDHSVAYLDLTGSGNETAAHLLADGRMTILFCGFSGAPMILRLYGTGRVLARRSDAYAAVRQAAFADLPAEPLGARQMVCLDVDLVRTSCGFGVPLFDHRGERDTLQRWAEAKGVDGLVAYRRQKNLVSLDGLPTGLAE